MTDNTKPDLGLLIELMQTFEQGGDLPSGPLDVEGMFRPEAISASSAFLEGCAIPDVAQHLPSDADTTWGLAFAVAGYLQGLAIGHAYAERTRPAALGVGDELRVGMERKPSDLNGERVRIVEVIQLDNNAWSYFRQYPVADHDWLTGKGGPDQDGTLRVILVRGPDGEEAIVNPEGGNYARYAARIR